MLNIDIILNQSNLRRYMYSANIFFSLILAFSSLFGAESSGEPPQKIIELVPTFYPAPEALAATLTRALAERNCPLTVVSTDLSHYGDTLIKARAGKGKWLRRLHLDFPKTIPVDASVAKIAFWNASADHLRHTHLEKLPKEKLLLFMWEPPTC